MVGKSGLNYPQHTGCLTLTYLYFGELGSNPRALFICGINGVDSNGPAADVTFPLTSNLRPERCLVDIGDDTMSGIVEFNFILAIGFEGLGELSLECTFLFHIMDGVSKYKFTERLSNKCLSMFSRPKSEGKFGGDKNELHFDLKSPVWS